MSLSRTISFTRELHEILSTAKQISARIDQMKAQATLAQDASKDPNAVVAIGQQLKDLTEKRDAVEKVLFEKSNRGTVEAVEELIEDLSARIENAEKLFSQYRQQFAQMELMAAMDEFSDDPEASNSRKSVERIIETSKLRYEKQAELAAQLVPNKAIILL
jgi:phage shock protein A